jgi:hypothetical protein
VAFGLVWLFALCAAAWSAGLPSSPSSCSACDQAARLLYIDRRGCRFRSYPVSEQRPRGSCLCRCSATRFVSVPLGWSPPAGRACYNTPRGIASIFFLAFQAEPLQGAAPLASSSCPCCASYLPQAGSVAKKSHSEAIERLFFSSPAHTATHNS